VATWNTGNVVVTARGNEILSKVQLGIGSISLSRVVTGSGRVIESQLYNQTAVTDIKQVMDVISADTTSYGSSLEIQVSNTGLLAEYSLNQIGVYVTHPDYVGEQLYLIAQCDSGTADNISLPTETPTVLSFSIYMEHNGTTAVTIEVIPAGSASVVAFNAHVTSSGVHFVNETEKNSFQKKITVGLVKPTDGSIWFETIS
jgi:hypothetical protein